MERDYVEDRDPRPPNGSRSVKLPEIWQDIAYPRSDSGIHSSEEYRIYHIHLGRKFLLSGRKLVREYFPDRRTKVSGKEFIQQLVAASEGGAIAVDSRSTTQTLSVLYNNGCVHLQITSPEDGYVRPDLGSPVDTYCYYTGTEEFVSEITLFFKGNTIPIESQGSVYVMISGAQGPEFRAIGNGGEAIIRDNYSKEVLKSYDRIADTLVAKVPPGRINILSGPPGTGKTYLIRGLINQVPHTKFAIVQASMVASLANPSMLPALLNFRSENQPIVFIIEDAEECLATRDAGNNSAVSALLNMGDGVLGSLIDLRIVATTNTAVQDLDPAIRRPGRLSTICEVGPLTANEAAVVFDRLTYNEKYGSGKIWDGWDPNARYTIAEVYQKATDAGWRGEEVKTKKSMGFT